MSMNGLKYICLACIIPFLPSCIQEEHMGDAGDDGRVTVSLTFTTRTEEGADEGMESDEGNNENLIRTVRVYVFDGSDGSLTGYHHADLSDKNVTEKSFNIRLGFSRHTIPADGHTCLFYAIANEGSAEGLKSLPAAVYDSETGRYVWTDDKEITQRELLELTFSGLPESKLTEGDPAAKDETGKKYSSSILPMAVKQEVVITKETENLTLPLRRSLGKMELYFAKGGIGEGDLYIGRGVYLYNIPTKGYLFSQDAPALESSEIAHRESDKATLPTPHIRRTVCRSYVAALRIHHPTRMKSHNFTSTR